MKKALQALGPCPQCSKTFESRYLKVFCSLACYVSSPKFKEQQKANNQKKKNDASAKGLCRLCGAEFFAKKSRKQQFCCKPHYRQFMAERFDRWIAAPQNITTPQAFDEYLTQAELPCLIDDCDWTGKNLGHHVNFTHGITAKEFKKLCGFNLSTGLVTQELSEHLSGRPHLALVTGEHLMNGYTGAGVPRYLSAEGMEHRKKARALAAQDFQNEFRSCKSCGSRFESGYNQHMKVFCSVTCRTKHYTTQHRIERETAAKRPQI